MKQYAISIITPIYNEQDIVVSVVKNNIALLESYCIDYEMILVNDGSDDSTGFLLDSNFSNSKNVYVIHNTLNMGMGGAIRKGISKSKKHYLFCLPADSPLENKMLEQFLANIGKADILVSYRLERVGYSKRMLLNSYVFHFLVSRLFDIKLKDYNWIHLYDRKIFESGAITIENDGLFMLAEVLIKAKRAGYSFVEFPVTQPERLTGVASAAKISNVVKTLIALTKLWIKLYVRQ